MSLSLIYARSENYCIGRGGDLPWSLPDEFEHFTRTTSGGVIIMGRKTYQDHNSYLSNRINIVVSRSDNLEICSQVQSARSLIEALDLVKSEELPIYVIGGKVLFREAFPLAKVVYESVIHASINGDTYVDPFDFHDWSTEVLQEHAADAEHAYGFTIYRHAICADIPVV